MTSRHQVPNFQLGTGATDFRLVALQPGTPILDRGLSYWPLVLRWLGRFAGDPEWVRQSVRFHVRTDQGQRLTSGIVCEPIDPRDLRRSLKREWNELQSKLTQVQATSRTEQAVLACLTTSLAEVARNPTREDLGCHFFKYRDPDGKLRLLWCWGYDRCDLQDCQAAVCVKSDCSHVFLRRGNSLNACPYCQTALPVKRNPLPRIAALILLMFAVGSAGYWYLFLSATLTGTVINGVDKSPLASARVSIRGLPQVAQTDAQGTFQLTGLPPGTKEVTILREGFAVLKVQTTVAAATSVNLPVTMFGDAVVVGRAIDAVTLTPVSGVRIQIPRTTLTAVTDNEGHFRMEGVKGGTLSFQATAIGYPASVVRINVASGTETSATITLTGTARLTGQVVNAVNNEPVVKADVQLTPTGQRIQTDPNGRFRFEQVRTGKARILVTADRFAQESNELDLVENEAHAMTVLLVGSALLTGQVASAVDNAPIANAEVRVVDTLLSARTDKNGRFGLPGLRSGAAQIEVSAPGYSVERLARELVAGGETPVSVVMRGDAVVSGVVLATGTDRPVQNAQVQIAGTTLSVRTDNDGHFRLTGARSLISTVSASAPGYRNLEAEHQLLPGKETVIKLSLVGDATVSGTIANADGFPVIGAEVSCVGTSLSTLTDGKGTYRLAGIRSGPTQLKFAARGFPDEIVARDLMAGVNTSISITFTGTATVVGQVVNGLTRQPIPNATIRVTGTKLPLNADGEGRFWCEKLRGGPIELEVTADGYPTKQLGVTLEAGQETKASLVLNGDTILAGSVVDSASDEPIPHAEISLDNTVLAIQSNAEGKFRLEGGSAGNAAVRIHAPGYDDVQSVVALVSGKTTELKTRLVGNAELMGQVVTDDGAPLPGATISRLGTNARLQTNQDGKFRWSQIPSGIARLTISATGYESIQLDQELEAAKVTTLSTVKLSSNVNLVGQIINAITNQPIPDAQLELLHRKASVTTDADGRFRYLHVPVQPFKVRVIARNFQPETFDVNPRIDKSPVRYVLSPELKRGEFRVVLTWGNEANDLDLHLYGPLTVSQRYHVSPKLKIQGNATLDVDNRNGPGPETVSISRAWVGKHEIKVHAHRDPADAKSTDKPDQSILSGSSAIVRVYTFGAREPQVVPVDPKGIGSVWNVGRMEVIADGTIQFVKTGTYTDALPRE